MRRRVKKLEQTLFSVDKFDGEVPGVERGGETLEGRRGGAGGGAGTDAGGAKRVDDAFNVDRSRQERGGGRI